MKYWLKLGLLWSLASTSLLTSPLLAADMLGRLNVLDANQGIREALSLSSQLATERLGRIDGFLGDDQQRIPLPAPFSKHEKMLRGLGLGPQTNELLSLMNRCAEGIMPIARDILESSSRQVSPADAKALLSGPPDAVTQYFKARNESLLKVRLLPLVRQQLHSTQLLGKYQKLERQAIQLGLMRQSQSINMESYLVDHSLNRLFNLMTSYEREIRINPYKQQNHWIEKAFGAVRLPND